MCSTASSAKLLSSFISCETTSKPSWSAGGDLHTFAVITFCKFVAVRVFKTSRKASQILLTLELFAEFEFLGSIEPKPLSTGMPFSSLDMTLVSLYIDWVTSSSLRHRD